VRMTEPFGGYGAVMLEHTVRGITVGLAGTALALAISTGGAAQSTHAPIPTCLRTPGVSSPGRDITVRGQRWEASSSVDVAFDDEPSASVDVSAHGRFRSTVTVPDDAARGTHSLNFEGTDGNGDDVHCARIVRIGVSNGSSTSTTPTSTTHQTGTSGTNGTGGSPTSPTTTASSTTTPST